MRCRSKQFTAVAVLLIASTALLMGAASTRTRGDDRPPPTQPPQIPGMPSMPPMPGQHGWPIGGFRPEPALGVVTGPVSEQVRAHVELPEGMGLIVEGIDPTGPAARAGLRRFDILRKFQDQMLCSPDQLTALAKAAGKGNEVTLTVIHAGKEREVSVRLDESERKEMGRGVGRHAQAHAESRVETHAGQSPSGDGRSGPPMRHSQRVVMTTDGRGTAEIRETDGQRTVTVRDPAGRNVNVGRLDSEADWEQVPEGFREMVRELAEKLGGREGAADRE